MIELVPALHGRDLSSELGGGVKEREGKKEEAEQQELGGASRSWSFVKWVKWL